MLAYTTPSHCTEIPAAEADRGVGADLVQEPQGARVPAPRAGQVPRRDDGDVDQRLRHQRGVPVRRVGRLGRRAAPPPRCRPRARPPAGTLTFSRGSMCGEPARTVGWREPGFIHSAFMRNLWPNKE